MPRTRKRSAAARFCRACGYEFARDTEDDCPMCARFEQFRTQFAVPRPSELAGRRTNSEERLDVDHPVASADRSPTASEYRAILAAQRRTTASPDDGGGPAETVIRTPALRQPPPARREAQTKVLSGESQAHPEKSTAPAPIAEGVRNSSPEAAEQVVIPGPQPLEAEPTAPVEPSAPSKKSTAPRRRRSTTATKQDSKAEDEPLAPSKKSTAPRRKRSTTATKQDSIWDSSAAAEENTSHRAPDSHRAMVAWAVGRDAESFRRGGIWPGAVWVAIVAISALIGASVPILVLR